MWMTPCGWSDLKILSRILATKVVVLTLPTIAAHFSTSSSIFLWGKFSLTIPPKKLWNI
jgi:hypothetical protein